MTSMDLSNCNKSQTQTEKKISDLSNFNDILSIYSLMNEFNNASGIL